MSVNHSQTHCDKRNKMGHTNDSNRRRRIDEDDQLWAASKDSVSSCYRIERHTSVALEARVEWEEIWVEKKSLHVSESSLNKHQRGQWLWGDGMHFLCANAFCDLRLDCHHSSCDATFTPYRRATTLSRVPQGESNLSRLLPDGITSMSHYEGIINLTRQTITLQWCIESEPSEHTRGHDSNWKLAQG